MEQKQYTTTILTASPDHYLTQSDDSLPASRRVTVSRVCLASGDSPLLWREITAHEAVAINEAREKAIALEAQNYQSQTH